MTPDTPIAGKYRLLRQLGKGAMGEVWAALHIDMGREVALKLIYEDSPDLALRLKREALALGRLEHPNVVRIYDVGETDGRDPFLVMELLSGETLADRMAKSARLLPAEALRITIEVARALEAAHEAGIVHRDLKPANVYLHRGMSGEEVKVLDFGVSKILSFGDMAFTVSGALVGSPAYMSPEAARALKEIDARADLWSLGVLLFEMMSGRRPFPGTTVVGVVAEIISGPIPRLSSVVPAVDPRIEDAIARCLVRDVDKRIPSATALIEALTPALEAARGLLPAAAAAPGTTTEPTVVRPRPERPPKVTSSTSDEAPTVVRPGMIVRPPKVRNDDDDDAFEAQTVAIPVRAVEESAVVESDDERTTNVMHGREALAFRNTMGLRSGQPLTRIKSGPDADEMQTVVKPNRPLDDQPLSDEDATVIKLTPPAMNPAIDTVVIPPIPAHLPGPVEVGSTQLELEARQMDRYRTLIAIGVVMIIMLILLIVALSVMR